MYTDQGVPAVPVDWILATILGGAKKSKQGPLVKAGLFAGIEAYFPLVFPGPKTIDELWADGRFCDYRGVAVGQAKIMRARPIFPGWSLSFSLPYDPDTVDGTVVETALEKAGKLLGMGDYRPRFGRFEVESCSHA